MKEEKRFFLILNRISSVLLFCLLAVIVGGIAWAYLAPKRFDSNTQRDITVLDKSTDPKKAVALKLQRPVSIGGANTQLLELTVPSGSYSISSGGTGNGEIRNVLFIANANSTAHWLFKDNHNVIPTYFRATFECCEKRESSPVRVLYFEYFPDAGRASNAADQHVNVALSKPDGTGLIEVLKDIDRVLSYQMLDSDMFAITYQQGNVVKQAKYAAATLALVTDQTVIALP